MKIFWTENAMLDQHAITVYLASERPSAARRWGRALRARVRLLAETPRSGTFAEGHEHEGIRQIVFGNYRIFYRIADEAIFILHIRDTRRRAPERIGEAVAVYQAG